MRTLLIDPHDRIVGVGSEAAMRSERVRMNRTRGFADGDQPGELLELDGYITLPDMPAIRSAYWEVD